MSTLSLKKKKTPEQLEQEEKARIKAENLAKEKQKMEEARSRRAQARSDALEYLRTFEVIEKALPLKQHIHKDIIEVMPDHLTKKGIRLALNVLCRRNKYRNNLATENSRYDLDANPVEPMTEESRTLAQQKIKECFKRMGGQKKKAEKTNKNALQNEKS